MRMAPAPRLHASEMQVVTAATQSCFPPGPEYILKVTACREVLQRMHWKPCMLAVGGTLNSHMNPAAEGASHLDIIVKRRVIWRGDANGVAICREAVNEEI